MDKLEAAFKGIVDELTRERNKLAILESDLTSKEQKLLDKQEVLNNWNKQLEARIEEVSKIENVKAQKEENERVRLELEQKAIELKIKENGFKKQENKLFEIKSNQDQKQQDLETREEKLRYREAREKQIYG